MKKLIFALILITFISGFSQRKITVTNLTSSAMKIYGIRTKPVSGTYPYCYGYGFALYSGQSYTLVNNLSTTKFPFYSSPTSLPQVASNPYWKRVNSPTSSLTSQTGLSLWNSTIATSQAFNFLDFSIGSINGLPSSYGIIGILTPNGYLENISEGWGAFYDKIIFSPTSSEETITFIDL